MQEDKALRDIDDTSPSKSGTLRIDLICLSCGDVRGTAQVTYNSDKDRGLFRAIVICNRCQDKPEMVKRLADASDSKWGMYEHR